jgi:tetratricopeptide (TPR) repeat protein
MRKRLFLACWCLLPIGLIAYHYGPGQRDLARNQAAEQLKLAHAAESAGEWREAVLAYDRALSALPPDDQVARTRLQIARFEARTWAGELPEAIVDLEDALTVMRDKQPQLETELRARLAAGEYYLGWLMRLEGAPSEEWTLEVDQARQHFKHLAEQAQKGGQTAEAVAQQKNLEAVIRLARMDLSELESLPLPMKCQGNKNCSQKCRSQRESRCENPAPKEKKDARNAGAGKRPEGIGS